MMRIAFYVTSHGFGHASRISALVQEYILLGCECYIITDRPEFLFPKEGSLCHIFNRKTDTGMMQLNWKVPDINHTFTELEKLWINREEIISEEEAFLLENKINFVLVDIPFLPILAAKRVNIPVYAITNFDWYFNYKGITDNNTDERIISILESIRDIYQLCDKSYILPFSKAASVQALPRQIKCGILAKYSQPNRDELCRKFNLDKEKKIALITFGGINSNIGYFKSIINNDDYIFLTNSPITEAKNLILLPRNIDYSQIISSCDLVITKVGYSTLAETCTAGTYLCYATRENFPEDDALVNELENYSNCQRFHLQDSEIKITLPKSKIQKEDNPKFYLQNKEISLKILTGFLKDNYNKLSAIIDFGTNNSTLLIYSLKGNIPQVVFYDIRITGIGLDMDNNVLCEKSIKHAVKELSIQLDLCSKAALIPHILVTNIGRVSKNFNQLQEMIENDYKVDWEIISANREADLGVKSTLLFSHVNCDFYNVDIGGSSTEITLLEHGEIVQSISLSKGILCYFNRFKDSRHNYEQISEIIQQDFEEMLSNVSFPLGKGACIVGLGKVFHNLACIYEGKEYYEHFSTFKQFDLQDFLFNLHNMINHKVKYKYYDYNGKKLNETVFYISLAFLQALNNVLDTNKLVINPWGIEFGYLKEKENLHEI